MDPPELSSTGPGSGFGPLHNSSLINRPAPTMDGIPFPQSKFLSQSGPLPAERTAYRHNKRPNSLAAAIIDIPPGSQVANHGMFREGLDSPHIQKELYGIENMGSVISHEWTLADFQNQYKHRRTGVPAEHALDELTLAFQVLQNCLAAADQGFPVSLQLALDSMLNDFYANTDPGSQTSICALPVYGMNGVGLVSDRLFLTPQVEKRVYIEHELVRKILYEAMGQSLADQMKATEILFQGFPLQNILGDPSIIALLADVAVAEEADWDIDQVHSLKTKNPHNAFFDFLMDSRFRHTDVAEVLQTMTQEVGRSRKVMIVGPSGAGKTTAQDYLVTMQQRLSSVNILSHRGDLVSVQPEQETYKLGYSTSADFLIGLFEYYLGGHIIGDGLALIETSAVCAPNSIPVGLAESLRRGLGGGFGPLQKHVVDNEVTIDELAKSLQHLDPHRGLIPSSIISMASAGNAHMIYTIKDTPEMHDLLINMLSGIGIKAPPDLSFVKDAQFLKRNYIADSFTKLFTRLPTELAQLLSVAIASKTGFDVLTIPSAADYALPNRIQPDNELLNQLLILFDHSGMAKVDGIVPSRSRNTDGKSSYRLACKRIPERKLNKDELPKRYASDILPPSAYNLSQDLDSLLNFADFLSDEGHFILAEAIYSLSLTVSGLIHKMGWEKVLDIKENN